MKTIIIHLSVILIVISCTNKSDEIEEKLIHIRDNDYPYLQDFGLFYFSSMLEYPSSVREMYDYFNHHKEFGVDTLLLFMDTSKLRIYNNASDSIFALYHIGFDGIDDSLRTIIHKNDIEQRGKGDFIILSRRKLNPCDYKEQCILIDYDCYGSGFETFDNFQKQLYDALNFDLSENFYVNKEWFLENKIHEKIVKESYYIKYDKVNDTLIVLCNDVKKNFCENQLRQIILKNIRAIDSITYNSVFLHLQFYEDLLPIDGELCSN